jgi:hypothetical protein
LLSFENFFFDWDSFAASEGSFPGVLAGLTLVLIYHFGFFEPDWFASFIIDVIGQYNFLGIGHFASPFSPTFWTGLNSAIHHLQPDIIETNPDQHDQNQETTKWDNGVNDVEKFHDLILTSFGLSAYIWTKIVTKLHVLVLNNLPRASAKSRQVFSLVRIPAACPSLVRSILNMAPNIADKINGYFHIFIVAWKKRE